MESFCLNLSFKSEDADILRLDWSEEDDAELMAFINCDVLPLPSETNKIKLSSSPLHNTANVPAELSSNSDKFKTEAVKESKPDRSRSSYRPIRKLCSFFMEGRCKFGSRCYNFHSDRHRREESEFRYNRKRSIDKQDAKERSRRHNSRNSSEYGSRKRARDYSRSRSRSRGRSYTNKKRRVR